MDLYTTITNGVPTTAMLAWGEQLPQTDILSVAAFVTTLRGQNLPGKEPQGEPVEKFQ
jgi:mono/diheme cytochrome c family protein